MLTEVTVKLRDSIGKLANVVPVTGCCGVVLSSFVTPWTIACQAPLSMEFSSQEYWSGLPFPFPGDLPNPGIEPESSSLQVDSLLSELHEKP